MAYGKLREALRETWDFAGSAAATGAATFAVCISVGGVYGLGYALAGAAGLGTGLSFVAGVVGLGVVARYAALPLIIATVGLGGSASLGALFLAEKLGIRPNGWGLASGVALGVVSTFSAVSALIPDRSDVDSMLKNTEPSSVVAMDETGGALSEQFASADREIIVANDQFFTVGAPKAQATQSFQL